MAVKGSVKNFTAKGGTVSNLATKPIGFAQPGFLIPGTNRVMPPVRPVADNGLHSGGAVKILNAASLDSRVARRRGGLGFGPVGDKTY